MAQVNPVQIEKVLKGVDYPVTKAELIKYAERQGADSQMKAMLQQLPDQKYEKATDVSKAVGAIERSAH